MRARILTAIVAVAFAGIICEGLTRLWVPDPALQFENRIELFVEDAIVGYRNAPNYRAYAQGFIRVQTNSLGFRGSETTRTKAPGTFRILGLGDSVTWGVGVQEEDTFLSVVARTLNAGTRRHVEAINAAVIGYSLHQERLTLERDGVSLTPDLVIVGFVLNDFYPTEDPFNTVQAFHRPARIGVRRLPYAPTPPVYSYLYRFLRSGVRVAVSRVGASAVARDSAQPGVSWPPSGVDSGAWSIMEEHFRAMKQLAVEHHFHLVVIVLPSTLQYKPLDRRPQDQIVATLAGVGIDSLDLFDALSHQTSEMFRDTMHLSEAGHSLVATELVRFITARGWLDSPGDPPTQASPAPAESH